MRVLRLWPALSTLGMLGTGFFATPASAQTPPPEGISFQAFVTDDVGTPIEGVHSTTLKLFDMAAGGTQLWTRTYTPGYAGGIANLILEDGTPDLETLAFDRPQWLEVTVESDVQPRVPLQTVPYAHSLRALRVVPGPTEAQSVRGHNLIGGHPGNSVGGSFGGSTIGGGGFFSVTLGDFYNSIMASQATIGGGAQNSVTGYAGTISGGQSNAAEALGATVGGGLENTASGGRSVAAGGEGNTALGPFSTVSGGHANEANVDTATVGGGAHNTASGLSSVVSGGGGNVASGNQSAIGGGGQNTADGLFSAISGGTLNHAEGNWSSALGGSQNLAQGLASTVGGGWANWAQDLYSTVSGGRLNWATGDTSAVGGGVNNQASGSRSTISGGSGNRATAGGSFVGGGVGNLASSTNSTVGGGFQNKAGHPNSTVAGGSENLAGGSGSMVAGGTNNVAKGTGSFAAGLYAKANHIHSFVWSSTILGESDSLQSTADGQFTARAYGGFRFFTSSSTTNGAELPANSGSWSSLSSVYSKTDFENLSEEDILERLGNVDVMRWRYKGEDASIRHVGPMAQDFYSAFGLGKDDEHIATVDADGIALAAIKALRVQNLMLLEEIGELKRRLSEAGIPE